MRKTATKKKPTIKASGQRSKGPERRAKRRAPVSPIQIYEQLRQRIATRLYPPGMRLSESELATEFGLSRTPIRQALQRLATDGLVAIKNGVGATVTDLDRIEIDQAYYLRCQLAAMIGQTNPKPLSQEDLAELKAVHLRVKTLLSRRGSVALAEFSELCERFHNIVNNVIGSRMLRDFIEILYHQTDRFWFGWMSEADMRAEVTHFLHEVEETQRALEINDFEAVGYIRRNHITMMLARMSAYRDAVGT
ncbi:GntR family transcriptional regulator [Dongia sp.]|uniref:GntR family transcriptional regulator n=1 Tax=Dongia sp. TaxID=1977262 RepID=UPI0035B44352